MAYPEISPVLMKGFLQIHGTQLLLALLVGAISVFGTVKTLGIQINDISVQLTRVENTLIAQDARLRAVEQRSVANLQELRDLEKTP